MPLEPKHIIDFLENVSNEKFGNETLYLLLNRIDKLCFEECQIDRIACTLTPMCTRRFLLKLRIKNGLTIENLPKFCYSVEKNVLHRDFYGKTVVYKPFDVYLYLVDFLDVFFHGDYRKLNKFISFQTWDDALKIFDERIENGEDFQYKLTDNFMVFKYVDKIHVLFLNEKIVLSNANRETIADLEILYSLCELYRREFFPEFKVRLNRSKNVVISVVIPREVVSHVSSELDDDDVNLSKLDDYFWNLFPNDLEALSNYCYEISLSFRGISKNLFIRLYLNLETNNYIGSKKKFSLRYRDLRLLFNFVYRIYDEFYIFRLSEIVEIKVKKEKPKLIAKEKEIRIEPKPKEEIFEHKKIEVIERRDKIVVEKELHQKFENENPGKKAIWRGKETKDFLEWKKN